MAEGKDAGLIEKGGEEGADEPKDDSCLGYMKASLSAMFLEKWYLSLLHVCLPLALYFAFTADKTNDHDQALLFTFSLLSVVPLAERLGYVTEQLALHMGETAAGLMNVCMGNVPELIVVIVAVVHETPKVVTESLIGGVLSNLLLVAGLSLLAGGIRNRVQTFSTIYSNTLLVGLVLMAVIVSQMSVLPEIMYHDLPYKSERTVPHEGPSEDPALNVSRLTSVIAILFYCAFLLFSLKTHKDLVDEDDADGDDDEDVLGLYGSLFWLALLTALISIVSDGLVDAIEGAARATNLSELFITAIILPNVNNAPEHAVAIRLGWNNKTDAVIAIAVGSAAQLALFLLPIGILTDWFMGGSFDLHLDVIEAVGFALSVLFAAIAFQSGKSTWLLGVSLLLVYTAIAASWFYAPATVANPYEHYPNGTTQAVLVDGALSAGEERVVMPGSVWKAQAIAALASGAGSHALLPATSH